MVRQAREGLRAHDIRAPGLNQLDDLGGQQPAFAGLHADGRDFISGFHQLLHAFVLAELAVRGGDGATYRVEPAVERPPHDCVHSLATAGAQMVLVPLVGVRVLGHEFDNARHHSLATLRLDLVDDMVVGVRMVFDENLTYHTDTRLARDIPQRQLVEGAHDLLEQLRINPISLAVHAFGGFGIPVVFDGLAQDCIPLFVQGVRAARFRLVGADAVQAFHEQIAVHERFAGTFQHRRCRLEARVAFQPLEAQRDDRNLWISGVNQRLADQTVVVGGSTHAAGLRNGERHMIGIVLALDDGVHQLSDDHDRRIAGVVVHVFEAGFDIFVAGVFEHVELVASGADDGFDQ